MNFFRQILICLLFVLLTASLSHAKRLALVIGNDNYISVSKLQKAGNDADAMARELKAAGFEVQLQKNVNFRTMVRTIESFTNSINSGDEVVVFFAGHGVQIKSGNYILPTDIEAETESEVEKMAYGLNELTEKLSDAKAGFALVVVDACRDNPMRNKGRSIGSTRGLSPVEPAKGQMVVYSASKGQQALDRLSERDSHPNGVFTREFIARMRKPGVKIEEMVREVQDAVESLAKTVSHDQRPALYNEARGNFYFYAPTTINILSKTVTDITESQREEIFWSDAKLTANVEAFEAYVVKYPEGQYTSLAKANITRLKNDIVTLVKESKATNTLNQTDSETTKPSPLLPGTTFKDCPECPEMVVVPAGSFDMGGTESYELPIHRVTLNSFAIGKTEITQAQWKAVMGDYYYLPIPDKKIMFCEESNKDNCPASGMSWAEVKLFVINLNTITGRNYRLPSESEWEYSCRAGGRHDYCGGDDLTTIAAPKPNAFFGNSRAKKVASRNPNVWGLYDMTGNVYEWTEDCWNDSYNGAPSDGSAWTSSGDCYRRVFRGGATYGRENQLRSGSRPSSMIKSIQSKGWLSIGFRIARDN